MAGRNRAVQVATVSQDGIPDRPTEAYLEATFQRLA